MNSLNPHNNPMKGSGIIIPLCPDLETEAQSAYFVTVTGLGFGNTKGKQADIVLS